MTFPDPVVNLAIEPKSKADETKLGGALHERGPVTRGGAVAAQSGVNLQLDARPDPGGVGCRGPTRARGDAEVGEGTPIGASEGASGILLIRARPAGKMA